MMILRKACVYRLFTNETSRYDTDPGHRYFCLSCQQLTANQYEFTSHYVDCSRSLSLCQPLESNRGLSERQFLHSSTGESNTSCWVFHKQMVESFQTLAQYWKPIQNLGTKIWHHLKNNILSMVMLKLWANLSPSYVKSWLNVKLFIISCCLAVQEVLCSPAVEGHKPG